MIYTTGWISIPGPISKILHLKSIVTFYDLRLNHVRFERFYRHDTKELTKDDFYRMTTTIADNGTTEMPTTKENLSVSEATCSFYYSFSRCLRRSIGEARSAIRTVGSLFSCGLVPTELTGVSATRGEVGMDDPVMECDDAT
jgi:hypothetical protein